MALWLSPLRFNTASEIIYVSRLALLYAKTPFCRKIKQKTEWKGWKEGGRVEKMKKDSGQAGKEEKRQCGGRE